jgi:tRNA/tmRNA/rRNA uracil-C5-methylase (TrmA/RlmC/RlmD family)
MTQHSIELHEGDILLLRPTDYGNRGDAYASIGRHRIFVPFAAVGDHLLCRLEKSYLQNWTAKKLEILKTGQDRVEPLCSHFEICGGCNFQHLTYSKQAEIKRASAEKIFSNSALKPFYDFDQVEISVSPKPYHYRSRAQFHMSEAKLCFYKTESRDPVYLNECPLLEEGLFAKAQSSPTTQNDLKVIKNNSYSLLGREIQFDEDCFTQANLSVNQEICEDLCSEISKIPLNNSAWDLFAGVGNFSSLLISQFEQVTAVEENHHSLEFGKKNFPEVQWIQAQAASFLRDQSSVADVVVLDPPRSGCLDACRQLARLRPRFIYYISCNPKSLITDLIALVKKADYRIESWKLYDMFPQTTHIESVVKLEAKL